jgi:hypothetical protein
MMFIKSSNCRVQLLFTLLMSLLATESFRHHGMSRSNNRKAFLRDTVGFSGLNDLNQTTQEQYRLFTTKLNWARSYRDLFA